MFAITVAVVALAEYSIRRPFELFDSYRKRLLQRTPPQTFDSMTIRILHLEDLSASIRIFGYPE